MKINLIGQIFGHNGFCSHTRSLFNALAEQVDDIHLDVPLPPGWEVQANDAELRAIQTQHFNDGITIMIGQPNYWPQGLVEKQKKFYGFCVWEGDKVPKHFIKHLRSVDGVLVPSDHVKEAILNTEPTFPVEKIHLIPHGVDTKIFTPKEKPKDQPYTFVANKGWCSGINDRGGVQYLLKAYSEEFKKDEKVVLMLKINPSYNAPNWNIQEELNKLELPEDRAPIAINTAGIDKIALPNIYIGDCFVSPTRCEGFSLPCSESAASELPVITTNYGGQCDFIDEEIGWLISYDMEEVTFDMAYEGIRWSTPDITHLRKLMRYAFDHPDECKEKGKKGREKMVNGWTWKHTVDKLLKVIDK